jgi:hypothetical protein
MKNGFIGAGIYDARGELIVQFIAPGWTWSPLKLGCNYIADGKQYIKTYKSGRNVESGHHC